MSQSPPRTLGKYEILREIARSNDIVYEAWDPVIQRRVALKELVIPSGSTPQQQEERVRRFLREAMAAGGIEHPNIVAVHDVGEAEGKHYIAMEYLDGQTLRQRLDSVGMLEPKEAVEIALQVLQGLEFTHAKNVIHRDIKPENIQLTESGGVKLTDFGIARFTMRENITMDGQVFGTPSYMSPEQVRGSEIDARSDLFSLGVVLYEMVAGVKPFAGDSVVSITYAIMNKHPDQPRTCNSVLWQVIEQALEKSPQLRQTNASEFIAQLKQVLPTFEPGAMVIDPVFPTASNQPVPPPVIAPYAQPYGAPYPSQSQGPLTTPYGAPAPIPYAAQQAGQPILTPYGTPIPPQMPLPSQPYGQGQPYQPIPVYYPPPPKAPLLRPETKLLLGRMVVVFLLVSLLFGLVIAGINYMAGVASAPHTAAPPARALAPPGQPGSSQATKGSEPSPTSSDTIRAERLVRDARTLAEAGDLDGAEKAYRQAVQLAPSRPDYLGAMAAFYVRAAPLKRNPEERADCWKKASDAWAMQAAATKNPGDRDAIKQAAATSLYNAAVAMSENHDNAAARDLLYQARSFAPPGSPAAYKIEEFLRSLGA